MQKGGWGGAGFGGNKPKFEYKKPEDRTPKPKPKAVLLQDGLVLVKGMLTLDQQKEIVATCMDLGRKETGGFYVPRPEKDAKAVLKLKIMCLGYHWNSEERGYQETREDNDKTVPHPIPESYFNFCKQAVDESKTVNPTMPNITPTVIICNLYNENGSLGWHKDDDEDPDTIESGLPVVSLSFGEACKFEYKTFESKIKDVQLESGDALIFGGKSRLIGHRVASIVPNTSPLASLPNLRLNLTFREHTRKPRGQPPTPSGESANTTEHKPPKY